MTSIISKKMSQPKRILSIDGGGSRGVIPLAFLIEIERTTSKKIGQIFDLMVGTSTGSIIVASLACPDFDGTYKFKSASQLLDVYMNSASVIFSRTLYTSMTSMFGLIGPKYEHTGLKSVLSSILGKTKMNQLLNEVLLTSSTLSPVNYHEFTSSKTDIPALDAVMCSTAAPTFFPAYQYEGKYYADGGTAVNNPAQVALNEAISKWGDNNNILVSIGTGYTAMNDDRCHNGGIIQWAYPISGDLIENQVEVTDFAMRKVLVPNETYFRLDIPLVNKDGKPFNHSLDITDKNELYEMSKMVSHMLKQKNNREEFNKMCELLV